MYFLPHDINSLLDSVTPEERDRQLDDSIHDIVPRIAVKKNEYLRKALFCYQNAFQRDQEGWIQGLMADAWLEDNEPQEALQCYQAALRSMPGNPEYQAGLERTRRILEEHGRISAGYQLRSGRRSHPQRDAGYTPSATRFSIRTTTSGRSSL